MLNEQSIIIQRSHVGVERHPYVWDNPGKVIDRNGLPVDTTKPVWQLHDPTDNIDLNWDTLRVAPDIKDAIKSHVAHTIETQAPRTSHQVFQQLKYCFARLPAFDSAWDISFEAIETAIASARTERKDWHYHYVRKWYQWSDDQGVPGFSGEVASRLYRLKINVNPRGERVMSRDPNEGPLSEDEHYLIRKAVAEGKGRLIERVIIMLLLELGSRPIQLVQLECCDFIVTLGPSGERFYSLNVPRAKQRIVGRIAKKRRRISPVFGKLIEELIEQNRLKHGDRGPQMPILCVKNSSSKKLTSELKDRYDIHLKIIGFAQRIRTFVASANIISPRTGKLIALHPRRLRYTYFTRLAEQGTATNHLAELADHSNDKSIMIYVASASSAVERLNAALGKDKYYSDTINRFIGNLVEGNENEGQAAIIYGSAPTLKSLGGIGSCGANFLCNLFPPLSCYLCPKFQAWLDGPHEKLLGELEVYVQRLIERSGNPSDRIPYQLVDVMTAIRQLLGRIEELKNENREVRS